MSRAALYDGIGNAGVLYVGEVADAAPGPGEVSVRIRAAGLNPFDAKVRSGFAPSIAPFPRRIGADLAGTVEAVGDGATYWDGSPVAVGDAVLGRGAGSIAERVVTLASDIIRRPDGVPVEVAGGLYVAGLTAVSCLATVPIGSDDTVLVGGAAGAVGLVVCQLAIATGATATGTASVRNHDFLRSLGVEPVEYGERMTERVASLGTITAVIDCHGRDALDAGVRLGVPVDRMVAIAAYDAIGELGVLNVERTARTASNLAKLADAVAARRLVYPVAATFALDDVVASSTALESSHAPGKIVVCP